MMFMALCRIPCSCLLGARFPASILLDVAYGYKVDDGKDELVDTIENTMIDFGIAFSLGRHLVDLFTWRERLSTVVRAPKTIRDD
jgi:hypothetical protein